MQVHNTLRRQISFFFTLTMVLALLNSPAYAIFGEKVENFSAESYEKSPDGKEAVVGKLYWTPDAQRIDMDQMPGMGGPGAPKMAMTILVLKKQDKQYMYNHTKKLFFESSVDEDSLKSFSKELKDIQTEKVLENEKIEGYKCVKKEVVTSINVMGMTQKSKMIVWESDRFDFPLKQLDEDGGVSGMRNIKTGKPLAKVFKPLEGYTRVDNMMAVLGIDFGAMIAEDNAGEQKPASTNQKAPEGMGQRPNLEGMGEEAKKMMKGLFDQFKQ